MKMQKRLVCAFFSAFVLLACAVLQPSFANAALVRQSAKVLAESFSKKSAKEFAKFGGEAAVKKSLEGIAKRGGEKCAERAVFYAKSYGIRALESVEISPKYVLEALDNTPQNLRGRIFSIVEKNKSAIAAKLEREGADFLVLEAKYPAYGLKISELGGGAAKAARTLSESEVRALAKNVDALKAARAADSAQYGKFLEKLSAAPAATVALLEKNPKVLLAGTALAAFLGAKEEVMQAAESPMKFTFYGVGAVIVAFVAIKLYPFLRSKKRR